MMKSKTYTDKVKSIVNLMIPWYQKNARDLPWRRKPYCDDPYCVYVSEIMLQQTQVKTVIPFWERWLRELPTIEAAARAPSAKIHKLWEGLGYYSRVRNLQKAAQQIVQSGTRKVEHGNSTCQFPDDFDDVLALPGIGRYTAGAICSIAFNQPTPILDGNVIRVLTRIFGIAENPKEKITNARLWQLATELVGISKFETKNLKPNCSHLNQSLMELGALICTPRNQRCLICPVKKLCVAFKENRAAELPNLGKREAATAQHFIAFAVECGGKFLVQQRPAGVVNAHLWEFPNTEITDIKTDAKTAFQTHFGVKPSTVQPLRTFKHSITRYRITLAAYSVSLKKRPGRAKGRWLKPAEFEKLAFSSAHKKLASAAVKSMLSGR